MLGRQLLKPVQTLKRGLAASNSAVVKPAANAIPPSGTSNGSSLGLRVAGLAIVGVAGIGVGALQAKRDPVFRSAVDDFFTKISGRKASEKPPTPPKTELTKNAVVDKVGDAVNKIASDAQAKVVENSTKTGEVVAKVVQNEIVAETKNVKEPSAGDEKKAEKAATAAASAKADAESALATANEAAEVVKAAEKDAAAAAAEKAETLAASVQEKAPALTTSSTPPPAGEKEATEKGKEAAATEGEPVRSPRTDSDSLASLQAELKDLDSVATSQRFASIEGVLKDIEVRELALRGQVHAHSVGAPSGKGKGGAESLKAGGAAAEEQSLEGLSDAELRTSIRRLAAEMEMKSKWEALRLGHVLSLVEGNACKQSERCLKERQARADSALSHELARVKIDSENTENLKLATLERAAATRREAQLAAQHAAMKAEYEEKMEAELSAKQDEHSASLEAELAARALSAASEEGLRVAASNEAALQVGHLKAMRTRLAAFKQDSLHAQAVSGAIAGLGLALRSDQPVAAEAKALLARVSGGGGGGGGTSGSKNDGGEFLGGGAASQVREFLSAAAGRDVAAVGYTGGATSDKKARGVSAFLRLAA
mmetsp:Transcript_33103/g.65952  ORF Transcript_33103/g.65952 Transcript_33103/m.65952 type:complete len:599 (-) Transcript_33103:190-1986(-)